jgi:putative ABC transport system permease protein
MKLAAGSRFNTSQTESGLPVCVIGNNIKNQFFRQEDPIGKYIKCGQIWLKVIGVVEQRDFTASASDEMGISSSDNKIFIPVQTMLLRFKNRALLRADEIAKANQKSGGGGMVVIIGGVEQNDEPEDTDKNLNQLDKIIVQVKETEQLGESASIIKRMLLRRHSGLYDFEVTIPELLLKQQQKTKNIFNVVLGAIAGISLIVGGIGIMNIMLASVLERIREIGVRQAVGAKQKDIIAQFLAESTLISVSGGIIGIIIGVALSKIITAVFDIKTIVSVFSIFIAFGVSVVVGVLFGYLPAKKAAENDPVVSLRS